MFEQDQTYCLCVIIITMNFYKNVNLYKNVNYPEFEHHDKTVYPDID